MNIFLTLSLSFVQGELSLLFAVVQPLLYVRLFLAQAWGLKKRQHRIVLAWQDRLLPYTRMTGERMSRDYIRSKETKNVSSLPLLRCSSSPGDRLDTDKQIVTFAEQKREEKRLSCLISELSLENIFHVFSDRSTSFILRIADPR